MIFALRVVLATALFWSWGCDSYASQREVLVPAGSFTPLYPERDRTGKAHATFVPSFYMDVYPVTVSEFSKFVKENPEWQKSEVKRIFADSSYLKAKDSSVGSTPITYVSWFAAKAYCEWHEQQLPSVIQWEYAASQSSENEKRVLDWYSKPSRGSLPPVGSTGKNKFGLSDMQGLIWEWTLDFNDSFLPEDGRQTESKFFCGSGAVGAVIGTNATKDYARFMRYAFRSSLKASYTVGTLGFRCIREVRR